MALYLILLSAFGVLRLMFYYSVKLTDAALFIWIIATYNKTAGILQQISCSLEKNYTTILLAMQMILLSIIL